MKKSVVMLRAGAVLAGTAGTVLYLGSRFSGLIFILAAGLFWMGSQAAQSGWKTIPVIVKKVLLKMKEPATGVALALLLGGLLMLLTGYRPVQSYRAMFYGGLVKNWHVSVLNAIPLIFTGLSIALGFRGGLFNIGAEGQYYAGTMITVWLGLRLNMPALLVIPLAYCLGAAAGAACNVIPAWLKVKTGAHEVVTTMLIAYTIRTLTSLFVKFNGGDPETSAHPYISDEIFETAWLPRFNSFFPGVNYRLHIGILIAVATALLIQHMLFRTRLGFEIRAVGFNSEAARTQGIPKGRIIVITLLLSGALAAGSGVTQVLGLDHKMFTNLNAGYGWNGIAVAILSGNSPVGIIFTALLWGILDAGGQYMARTIQTPTSIVEIIKGMILFLILARRLFSFFRRKSGKDRSAVERVVSETTGRDS